MRQLAHSDAKRPIGCTQSTEIITTEGVELSGALPRGCDLATMYTAGVTVHAVNADPARLLIDLMTSADGQALRGRAGFLSVGR
jgi:molybdate transport system substrate-binding protein